MPPWSMSSTPTTSSASPTRSDMPTSSSTPGNRRSPAASTVGLPRKRKDLCIPVRNLPIIACSKTSSPLKPQLFPVFCSHLRSYKLYAQSVLRPTAFPGTSCFSLIGLKFGRCLFGATEFMGMAMSPRAKGIYYVPTGSFPVDNINEIVWLYPGIY